MVRVGAVGPLAGQCAGALEGRAVAAPHSSVTMVSRRLGDKRTRTDLAPTGGARTRDTSTRERQRFSLTGAQVRQVAALARRVETYEGHPVDIEWAVARGAVAAAGSAHHDCRPLRRSWRRQRRPGCWSGARLRDHLP
ncbi:hypothetical protein D4740_10320 [Actinomyces sp. 2119]|uniref:PEP/pyruvate-binding domain-containing protein n=1 Tax=Actinomyces sp. 2119 TaxID=2321393 RepID=UPI000FEDD180|nr:PEP/pyruvate-binding domain-containing protein [Actinomyces sp. 2119]RJF40921.1 hypothetical protein D4740_10320 [Actinomyces sp. 2119]